MAELTEFPRIDLKVTLALNEQELKALNLITSFDVDTFMTVFSQRLAGINEEEQKGMRSLFASIRGCAPSILSKLDFARKSFRSA